MLITEWDTEEAKEVWYEEGIEKGVDIEKLRNAANFKKLGVSVEIISQATGLTVKEIEAL